MTERPAPRTVVLVLADAPELPFVASALGLGFTAVSRDGWSAVVLPEGVDPAGLAAAGDPRSIAVRLDSDGSARALRVYPPVAALDAHEDWGTQFDELEESTTLRWPAVHEDSVAGLLAGARDAAGSDGPPEDRGTGGDAAASAPGGNLTAAASIASLCDLDPAQTARLENYARTASSALLLESVLQLLGLPVVAAKIVEGQREVSELDGVTHH